ncbi:hypothetical protein T484DRAFT_3590872 [Baffinella frigidus]|nr:hypothetical protein T484DRAFT_3590872 [Cryptophyta sp. CCMP2293]
MGGKRRAQPSGKEEGKTANGDGAAAEGGGSQKRQTLGLSVHGAAAGSGEHLVPVTMIFSVRFDPSALAGRKAALEAALRKVVMEFGGRDFKVGQLKVGASEDTLQRVLPFLIERVEPEGAAHLFQVCKPWRREMEARGFCNRTVQLCSAMAGDGDAGVGGWGSRITLRGLDPTMDMDTAARDLCADANAFLERSFQSKGDLRAWLQAASQETGGSFFERGAASTAECLGLHLVKWVGKPRGRFPGPLSIVRGHSDIVRAVAFSPDGTRIASASEDELVKIWNAATGQEVRADPGSCIRIRVVA